MAEQRPGRRTTDNPTDQGETRARNATKQEKPEAAGKGRDPENTLVNVVFRVAVPANTTSEQTPVFLAGTMNKMKKRVKDWDPKNVRMQRVDDTNWTVTLSIPENTQFEYKYTLGDWDHVEMNMY